MFGVDDAAAGAIIGGAATIIGTGTSAVAQSSLNKKTREFNREEAEKQRLWSEKMYNDQNAWNYEMWLKQNEYNSPTAQVNRLRDAGLNPLYYGLDGSSAGDLSAAQPLGYERASVQNQVNPFASLEDVATRIAQISNIQADTAKKGEETLSEVKKREKLEADIAETKQNIQNLIASEKLTDKEREKLEKDLEWLDRINEATVAAKEAEAKLSEENRKRIMELLPGEKELQNMSIEDFDHKWKKIDAEIAKYAAETGLLKEDIENYALNHMSNGFMGSGVSVQNIGRGVKSLTKSIRNRIRKSSPDAQGNSILAEDNR